MPADGLAGGRARVAGWGLGDPGGAAEPEATESEKSEETEETEATEAAVAVPCAPAAVLRAAWARPLCATNQSRAARRRWPRPSPRAESRESGRRGPIERRSIEWATNWSL